MGMESVELRKVVSLEGALRRALPIVTREAILGEGEANRQEALDWLFLYREAAELLIKEAGS